VVFRQGIQISIRDVHGLVDSGFRLDINALFIGVRIFVDFRVWIGFVCDSIFMQVGFDMSLWIHSPQWLVVFL